MIGRLYCSLQVEYELAASCKVEVNSSIVELLLSYHNDGSLNGTVHFAQTIPSLHSSNQPANCNKCNGFDESNIFCSGSEFDIHTSAITEEHLNKGPILSILQRGHPSLEV